MDKRQYKVADCNFTVQLEGEWNFMDYTPAVLERIDAARSGKVLDIKPTRAGDDVPARTFVTGKQDLPENWNSHTLDFSQYEPFAAQDYDGNPDFIMTVKDGEPQWLAGILESTSELRLDKEASTGDCRGGVKLMVKVNEMLPYYYIYEYGDKYIFEFEPFEGMLAGTLVVSSDGRISEYYSKPRIRPSSVIQQISTALMILFTFSAGRNGTMLFHASAVLHKGKAKIFLGTSGTGKSTHSRLWLSNIDGTELVNDDNPALKFVENEGETRLTVFGTPWSGKTPCYRNISAPVGAIVRLEQYPENKISRMSGLNAYTAVLPSISCIRWNKENMDSISKTVERIALSVPCFNLKCRPDADAAFVCVQAVEKHSQDNIQ